MNDGKEFSVTVDGVTKTFVATDGKVATVGVDPLVVPADTETEIKIVAKDVNGVVVYEAKYGQEDKNVYDVSISSKATGFMNIAPSIRLLKVGDTATAKVTWKSGKYDAQGKAEGNIESGEITITAVDPAVVDNFDLKIGDAGKSYAKLADCKTVKVGDTKSAYFMIKDANDKKANYANYEVESSNSNILTLGSKTIGVDDSVGLIPVNVGTAYILIKDAKTKAVVYSIEITVTAKSDVASLSVSKNAVTLSKDINQEDTVYVTMNDQYGVKISKTPTVTLLGVSGNDDAKTVYETYKDSTVMYVASADQVVFVSSYAAAKMPKGVYEYKVSIKDNNKVEYAQKVTVTIQEAEAAGTVADAVALEVSGDKDLKVTKDIWTHNQDVTIKLAVKRGAGTAAYLAPKDDLYTKNSNGTVTAKSVGSITYTIKDKDNTAVLTLAITSGGGTVSTTTTGALSGCAVINNTFNTITLHASAKTVDDVVKNIEAGTYNVSAKVTLDGVATPIEVQVAPFTISDSQSIGSINRSKIEKPDCSTYAKLVEEAFYYSLNKDVVGGDSTMAFGNIVQSVEGLEGSSKIYGEFKLTDSKSFSSGDVITIKKIKMQVVANYDDDTNTTVHVTLDLGSGYTFTAK